MPIRETSWFRGTMAALILVGATAGPAAAQVKTAGGLVAGTTDEGTGVRTFLGIPFAAPPAGDLRWKEPQPAPSWDGVRQATSFGHRCMQAPIYSDMIFRDEPSEDCLYLNVWTPAASADAHLPVMVWIYGGGFQAGSASEPRQDGSHLATKGIVVVSFNYRLGVFGFMAHPGLTAESPHHASGNYGLLDQVAALRWVQQNIAAFGGDPRNVTIFGESAGSFSVSALMASPVAKGLFARAIGESGAFFTAGSQTLAPKDLAASEQQGEKFAQGAGASSLADLRAKPAGELLQAVAKDKLWFSPNVDGYLMPSDAYAVFAAGHQNDVPLLAGWNADEIRAAVTLAKEKPTPESFAAQVRQRYGDHADAILKAYPASNDQEALEAAAALASDMFIGYSTWKWAEMQNKTGHAPVHVYSFDRKIPVPPDNTVNGVAATSADIGARHAGEIEYVFSTLDSVPHVTWEPQDRTLSDLMMTYWSNFAKNGNPSGRGVPDWPVYKAPGYQVMHLDGGHSGAVKDTRRPRYQAIDAMTETLRK